MILNKYVPTGFPAVDIIYGQNKRDLNGDLVDVQRGHRVGTQNAICASPGVGKTTLAIDMGVAGKHHGYPLWKYVLVDADGNPMEENRITKLTNFSEKERKGWFEVINMTFIEDIGDYLMELDKQYKAEKFKPVEFTNVVTGEKQKMMPYLVITFDTVTSLKSKKYSFGGDSKADVIANQQGMTEGRLKGDMCNSIINICDGNVIVYWLAHLKKNTPEMGKTIARKAYKSAPIDVTDHLPERFRQKLSFIFWINKVEDANNQESSQHPKYIYGFDDEGGQIYQANFFAVKSRSSTENRSSIKKVFENGKFNANTSLLGTLLNIPGAMVKAGGQYPTADTPSVFKGTDEEHLYKVSKREALKFGDPNMPYQRPFNPVEARKLLNYMGTDESILEHKQLFLISCLQALEDSFKYELECNNVSQDEITRNRTAFTSIYGFINQIKRTKNMSNEDLAELNKKTSDSNIELETSEDDFNMV